MTDREAKLVVGSLLHDVGKVIYRTSKDRRKHALSGHDYLKEEAGITDPEILRCVRYHHADALRQAKLEKNDLAYIVYIADNIASAADRRKNDEQKSGFEKSMPLQTVFNILNGNCQDFCYKPGMLKAEGRIPFPQKQKIPFDKTFYTQIQHRITENLHQIQWSVEYINSLMEVLEATLSFVPSSTAKDERADISLYDHVKMTAAVSGCIFQYLQESECGDYQTELWRKAKGFYRENAFLLFSIDISGIQSFIYTIVSDHALRTLRARSFYLEIMMEHIIDELLERLNLSRANLLYCGGGHAYFLLPNTKNARSEIDGYLLELKSWFLAHYQTALYAAGGYVPCSSRDLNNRPEGSYSELFRSLGARISLNKVRRYTPEDLMMLNQRKLSDYSRECRVCKAIGKVDDEGVCPLCRKIENLSRQVLDAEFFTVLRKEEDQGLPLPGNCVLVSDSEESLRKRMAQDETYVRCYGKNRFYTGKHMAARIWVGDYHNGRDFRELAKASDGICRIGVLRADVDNLGQTFVSGFDNRENHNRYVTLSRTATLSRQLSMFFKLYMNRILSEPEFWLDPSEKGKDKRTAAIIYSGGDDIFLVGAWNEVIELAVDLRRKLEQYTQGTLTISAGIGVYDDKYPIHAIAEEVGELENESKRMPGKNSVTLFEDGETHEEGGEKGISDGTYSWEVFETEVAGEKYRAIREFFDSTEDRGNAFLYRLLELIRNQKEKINFARTVYLLSRLEPPENADAGKKEAYRKFSTAVIKWIQSEKDRRQLKTAIQIYAYKTRDKEEGEN